ncbi:zf-TFIIB domain-containing protein, partial [Candidatus Gottesmanbacteria bacterium]|nr:zf-TFIIB domain-containing protein [Candidatus Gottesmanbacteria bacterium]
CPTCGNLLQKLSVTTNSNGKFDVDHCGRCGGTWFDPYEINRIPYHEVSRIAKLTVLPQKSPSEQLFHKCPRCHKDLVSSHYESVPKGVSMLRCSKCGGIWATQKALTEFKIHQEDTITEYKTGNTAFPSLSVVFVPAVFVLMLLFVTFTTIATLQQSSENRTKAENTISGITTLPISPTSVSIIFQTKSAVKSNISYGVDLFSMQTKTINQELSTNHHILLTGLYPKTLYIFKIILTDEKGRIYTTGENSFITKP